MRQGCAGSVHGTWTLLCRAPRWSCSCIGASRRRRRRRRCRSACPERLRLGVQQRSSAQTWTSHRCARSLRRRTAWKEASCRVRARARAEVSWQGDRALSRCTVCVHASSPPAPPRAALTARSAPHAHAWSLLCDVRAAAQVDELIERLLEVRGTNRGKQVQLAETDIRMLCLTAKEIFMSQPNLLELEAPIKICGALCSLLVFLGGEPRGRHPREQRPIGAAAQRQQRAMVLPLLRRRHPRAIQRFAAPVRVRGLPAGGELPLPGRLRGPRQAQPGDHLPAPSLQGGGLGQAQEGT